MMYHNFITIIIRNVGTLFFTINCGAEHGSFYEIVKQVRSIEKRLGVKLDTYSMQ